MKNQFRHKHLFTFLKTYTNSTAPLDFLLHQYFRQHKSLGSHDRRFLAETIYGLVRWRGLLDFLSPSPSWENKFNVYRTFSPEKYLLDETIPPHIRVSFPKELFFLLSTTYGEKEALTLCFESNFPAPTTIRVNRLKEKRENLLSKWKNSYSISPTPFSPDGLIFHKRENFFTFPEFKEGAFEMQDEGSQLIGDLVDARPRLHILDGCAGSGGKTLAFAPNMNGQGQIYLHDIRTAVLKQAKKRLKRAGVQNFQLFNPKPSWKGKMDRILLDVPCSGTGTLRRNPDMKWKFSRKNLESVIQEQRKIVKNAIPYLHPKGKLIYATCSILAEENHHQIAYFEKHFNLHLLSPPFCSQPERGKMDGFFGAVLRKAP